jgi:hypothetical protein
MENCLVNFFESMKYNPRTIFNALLVLGKLNFISRMPSFKPIFPRQIMQPLKSVWREIQISLAGARDCEKLVVKVEKIKDDI